LTQPLQEGDTSAKDRLHGRKGRSLQPSECTSIRDLDGRRVHEAHQHLVDLIEAKDGDQAEEFWTDHLRSCYLSLRSPDEAPLNFSA
jgi:DNA-binding GntR family transcriptional regulator